MQLTKLSSCTPGKPKSRGRSQSFFQPPNSKLILCASCIAEEREVSQSKDFLNFLHSSVKAYPVLISFLLVLISGILFPIMWVSSLPGVLIPQSLFSCAFVLSIWFVNMLCVFDFETTFPWPRISVCLLFFLLSLGSKFFKTVITSVSVEGFVSLQEMTGLQDQSELSAGC